MALDASEEAAQAITCRKVAGFISAYLEEHVHDSARAKIAAHLTICAGCRAYMGQIASVHEVMKLLPGPVMKFGQRARLREAFAARWFRLSQSLVAVSTTTNSYIC